MKSRENPITVYWTTSSFIQDEESWALLYRTPETLLSITRTLKSEKPRTKLMLACPAVTSFMSNVHVFTNAINNTVEFPEGVLTTFNDRTVENYAQGITLPVLESKLKVTSNRESSLKGYANVGYNMSWTLFSDEPLIAKFTAPYYPPTAPCEGALLSIGKFDIGSWYRPFNLDYHIPLNTSKLEFKEDDHLFYVEFETERPIIFKRFTENKLLSELSNELVTKYPAMFGKFRPLKTRYEDAKKAKIPQIVLSEIRKNVIE